MSKFFIVEVPDYCKPEMCYKHDKGEFYHRCRLCTFDVLKNAKEAIDQGPACAGIKMYAVYEEVENTGPKATAQDYGLKEPRISHAGRGIGGLK